MAPDFGYDGYDLVAHFLRQRRELFDGQLSQVGGIVDGI
jgi:hypothetical protein